MFEPRKVHESNLVAPLAQWKAASENAWESERAWLEITAQFQSSAEKT